MVACKFWNDGETRIQVVDINVCCFQRSELQTFVKRLGDGRAFEEVWSLPDYTKLVNIQPLETVSEGNTDTGRVL